MIITADRSKLDSTGRLFRAPESWVSGNEQIPRQATNVTYAKQAGFTLHNRRQFTDFQA